ncbi:MAG: hypothetical protein KGL11_00415 [Alphaproteobacteria bacterium]|nr:hypothetical protein [Alphaproteobacteria bacterium]
MPNELWNVLGALLIATVMLMSHPIKPVVAERLESEIAANWNQAQTEQGSCPADLPCLMPLPNE